MSKLTKQINHFLIYRDWAIQKEDNLAIYYSAKFIKSPRNFRLKIPTNNKSIDYSEQLVISLKILLQIHTRPYETRRVRFFIEKANLHSLKFRKKEKWISPASEYKIPQISIYEIFIPKFTRFIE